MNGFKKGVLRIIVVLVVIWPMLAMSAGVDLPKTGQTTCYDANRNMINCAGTGQDGDIQAGVYWPSPRFQDNGDGTMTDHLTGLVWLKNANCGGGRLWSSAVEYCNALASGSCGLSDGSVAGAWRLPSIIELESLVNAEVSNPATWLNSQGFSNVQSSNFWSATTSSLSTDGAWVVGMGRSDVNFGNKNYNACYVWPVRAGQSGMSAQPAETWQTGQKTSYLSGDDGYHKTGVAWPSPRFADNGDGTVTDNLTGLIWLKNVNGVGAKTWSQSLNFCNTLSSGSYGLADGSAPGDWRLPNRKELLSLIDYSRNNPVLPQGHPFSNVQSSGYWSATTGAYSTNVDWVINMFYGYVSPGNKAGSNSYVWPVRAGQSGALNHLTISFPNGGERLYKGMEYTIAWSSTGITGDIQIDLYKGGPVSVNWIRQIAASTENDGQYAFSPLDNLADGHDYYIGISTDNGAVSDLNDGPFIIKTFTNGIDADQDGYTEDEDCDDSNANIYPGATEIPNNGIDEDCTGGDLVDLTILDQDQDGFTPAQGDCNDEDATIYPNAVEIQGDMKDNNCDGVVCFISIISFR